MTKYVRDMSWKKIPEIAKDRASMALTYRRLRKDYPPLARLLYLRMREAEIIFQRNLDSNLAYWGANHEG
jgi:hypothetical protein